VSLHRTCRKADGGGTPFGRYTFGLMMSLNMLTAFGDAFDYSGVDFRGWCGAAGLRLFDVIPLAAGSTAAVAYR
jgi:hypothetical protein